MKDIVFLGSKALGAQCLQYLLAEGATLGLRVIAVATRQHAALDATETVASIANAANIPILESLEEMPTSDIIYIVQYHELLQPAHIAKAKEMALNLHLAPLPEYRGCNQFSFAIMDEAKEFGVSIHQLDAEIDHGTLFWEKRFTISADIWVAELVALANREAFDLFKTSLPQIAANQYSPVNTEGRSSAIHYRKEIDSLKQLSLTMSATELSKRIRATAMPGFSAPWFLINDKKVELALKKNY